MFTLDVVHDHLQSYGISKGYETWIFHGEVVTATNSSGTSDGHVQENSNNYGDIRAMLHDIFPMHDIASEPLEEGLSEQQFTQEDARDDAYDNLNWARNDVEGTTFTIKDRPVENELHKENYTDDSESNDED
ncbi:hypothetical protein FCV25MIE_34479 [Fagus crenata]